jgi:hypothetical protein
MPVMSDQTYQKSQKWKIYHHVLCVYTRYFNEFYN